MKIFQIPQDNYLEQCTKVDMINEVFHAGHCPSDGVLFHIYLLSMDDIILTHSY